MKPLVQHVDETDIERTGSAFRSVAWGVVVAAAVSVAGALCMLAMSAWGWL